MINKINKFLVIILPLVIAWFAFSVGGFKWGAITSLLLIIFTVIKFLPDIFVYIAMFNYKKDNAKTFKFLEKAYLTGKLKPNYILYYSYICLKEGNLDKAERLLNAVFAHKRTNDIYNSAKINLSLLLWKQGDLDKAIETLEEVGKEFKNTVYFGNMGYFLILKGEYKKALDFNLEAYNYNRDDMIILDNLAQTYYYMGSYQKSEEIYEELMQKNPQYPVPHYNYAKTLYALNKKEKAAEEARLSLGFPFTHLAGASQEEVASFLENVEKELGLS